MIFSFAGAALVSLQIPVYPRPTRADSGPSVQISSHLFARTNSLGFDLQIAAFNHTSARNGSETVEVLLDPLISPEGYQLRFGRSIKLSASTPTGVAWGLATLGQLRGKVIHVREIDDEPAVRFRCVSMDVARRFHSISTLENIVRSCQAGKVRYLQLHLTDDQNWMFPSVTFAGADVRNSSHHPAYTLAELKRLQAYAEARGVTIIPEVDTPGHSAIVAAIDPQHLLFKGSPSTNCLNFASSAVRTRVKYLLREFAAAFPSSPYIHLGGDEAWYPDAGKDPDMQAALKRLGPQASQEDVFVDYLAEMADTVKALGKQPLVWEGFPRSETARRQLADRVTVIAWSGTGYPARQLIPDGFDVVNAGWDPYYVVNHYPYDVGTLVPLESLLKSDFHKFGSVDGTTPSFTWPDSDQLKGSMLCWWEGFEERANQLLPKRIVAFGSRLWNPKQSISYEGFLRQTPSVGNKPHEVRTPSSLDLAVNCLVQTTAPRDPDYPAQEVTAAPEPSFSSYWLAYPNPQTLTIDLGAAKTVSRLVVIPCWAAGAPTRYRLAISRDGKAFAEVVDASKQAQASTRDGYTHSIAPQTARYVRIETLGGDLYPPTMTRICRIRVFAH